ncbi:MAG: hypothetical protein KBF99_12225 [Leptospiraceae bacterium]|nr:hypothetical protein [Leptospiraceae bacterium]
MKKNNLVYGDIIHMNDTTNDEISFIEIAKILVLRRKLFIGIFLFVFLISLIIAFLKRPTVEPGNGKEILKYTTYLYIGNLALNYPLEPQYLIEMKIKSIYSDELKNQYPLEVEYEETKISIMKLVTSLPKADSNEKTDAIIREFHSSILKPILLDHEKILDSVLIENAKNKETKGSPYTSSSRILKLAQKSEVIMQNPKSKIVLIKIILLGILAGFGMGFFGVFLLEFILQVRKSMKDNT